MIERRIKELSIALEALSRINRDDAAVLFNSIHSLLEAAVSQAQASIEQRANEAEATPKGKRVERDLDDEIPF